MHKLILMVEIVLHATVMIKHNSVPIVSQYIPTRHASTSNNSTSGYPLGTISMYRVEAMLLIESVKSEIKAPSSYMY